MSIDCRDPLIKEELLNEIFIAFLHAHDFCDDPSKELMKSLAIASCSTDLVIETHYKILARAYRDGKLDKEKLAPHTVNSK